MGVCGGGWAERAKRANGWVGCAGLAGFLCWESWMQGKEGGWKRGRWERGVGREGRGEEGIGADADGSPVGATPGDWREEKLERWMAGVMGRVCCVCEGLVGG